MALAFGSIAIVREPNGSAIACIGRPDNQARGQQPAHPISRYTAEEFEEQEIGSSAWEKVKGIVTPRMPTD